MHSSVPKTTEPPRRKVTLELRADLLDEAAALSVDVTGAVEKGLSEATARARAEAWSEEHRAAIGAYNERIARQGTFGERLRRPD